MSKSKIEWTEQTANPIKGCSKCSPACDNCDALKRAVRLASMRKGPSGKVGDDYRRLVTDGEWNGKTELDSSVLYKIVRRKKPTTYFLDSMGDIFHKSVPDKWVDQIMATIAMCPQHRFMILTKRRDRLKEYHSFPNRPAKIMTVLDMWHEDDPKHDDLAVSAAAKIGYEGDLLLKNLALGVSIWDQESMDNALEMLSKTPAAHLFISAEPLLGPVIASPDLIRRLSLVVVGGETGPKARPMHPDWARSLRDQCAAADVPFMLKSFGEWSENGFGILQKFEQMLWVRKSGGFSMPLKYWAGEKYDDSLLMYRVGKKAAGRTLDGVEHNGAIQWEVVR